MPAEASGSRSIDVRAAVAGAVPILENGISVAVRRLGLRGRRIDDVWSGERRSRLRSGCGGSASEWRGSTGSVVVDDGVVDVDDETEDEGGNGC